MDIEGLGFGRDAVRSQRQWWALIQALALGDQLPNQPHCSKHLVKPLSLVTFRADGATACSSVKISPL